MADVKKRIKVAQVTWNDNVLSFTFGPGTDNEVTVDVPVSEMSTEIRAQAEKHGFEQKLRDSYAGAGGDPVVALGMFQPVLDTLQAGKWSTRVAGEAREEPIALLAEALVRAAEGLKAQGVDLPVPTIDQAKTNLAKMERKQRDAVRNAREVRIELAKLKDERGKGKSLADVLGI